MQGQNHTVALVPAGGRRMVPTGCRAEPLERVAAQRGAHSEPAKIAYLVSFLAANASSDITGATTVAGGGTTHRGPTHSRLRCVATGNRRKTGRCALLPKWCALNVMPLDGERGQTRHIIARH